MARFGCRQGDSAVGAQSRAVGAAHRSKLQVGHNRVDDRLLEVDQTVDDPMHFVFLGGRLGLAVRIREKLGDGRIRVSGDRFQAA
ncbi:Uncharacterised protein [Mycobacteroides abscessus subsp. abscessus]|nr:Uncharacterised protein [Mycobacteroides abscessus subsp. abscessus]